MTLVPRARRLFYLTVSLIVAVLSAMAITTIPANAESNGGVRLMPLGDSITDGNSSARPRVTVCSVA